MCFAHCVARILDRRRARVRIHRRRSRRGSKRYRIAAAGTRRQRRSERPKGDEDWRVEGIIGAL